ncbi:MAG TPA: hypothetical protein VIL04_05595 [Solirubrobacterales bacterium]
MAQIAVGLAAVLIALGFAIPSHGHGECAAEDPGPVSLGVPKDGRGGPAGRGRL